MNVTTPMLPPAFSERMKKVLNDGYDSFVTSLNSSPSISIRVNADKLYTANDLESVKWCQTGRYLQERPVFTLDPVFHAGGYYVQEASSMFLEQALIQSVDLNQPLNVLDLCAAPGGKSTHLLSLISNESLLVSNEVIRSRASILSENIQKWGKSNVMVTNSDPEAFGKLKGFFDVIVVDAPCSGEGLFRKEPEAIKEWSTENVDLCSKRQRRILSDVWPALKSGGILVYCTCTYNPFENEDNLQWMKEQHDVEFLSIKTDSSWGINEVNEGLVKGYHFYPHKVKGEGFFISAIRKTGDHENARLKTKTKALQYPAAKISDQLANWYSGNNNIFLQWKDNILQMPAQKLPEIEFIIQHLHIISTGTTVAELKHDKLIPDHAYALSNNINKDFFSQLELTKEEALQYLRKETLQISNAKKGFTLMTYLGFSLGWGNVLDNRINNMYPPNWRIRMAG